MNWQALKDNIYYLDGSLRDIYILNTTKEDWKIWTDFVNRNYKTSFHNYETETTKDNIDFSTMLDYWNGERDSSGMATVYVDNIIVNAYFFDHQEIENDITPKEFNSIDDHERLIKYMTGVSKALNKRVVLTPENSKEIVLLSVDKGEIIFST